MTVYLQEHIYPNQDALPKVLQAMSPTVNQVFKCQSLLRTFLVQTSSKLHNILNLLYNNIENVLRVLFFVVEYLSCIYKGPSSISRITNERRKIEDIYIKNICYYTIVQGKQKLNR